MTRGQTIRGAIELQSSPEVAAARQALARMPPPLAGEDEVVRRMRENLRDALDGLDQLAAGNVERNAATRLKAIELLLRYTQPLPKQTVEHQGAVGIAVIDPYALPPADVVDAEVVEPAPGPRAVGPTIRRKGEATP